MNKSSLEALLSKLTGGNVLDVATGAGNFASAMEQSFTDCNLITAIDCNAAPLTHLREKTGSDKIIPAAMNGANLAFKDNSFDTVAISNSLHHLKTPGDTLGEMKRTLSPGGHFIIMEMFQGGNQTKAQETHTILHNWWGAVDSHNGVVHNRVFTEEEIKKCAESLGLLALEFHCVEETGGDPFNPEMKNYLNKALTAYEKRSEGSPELLNQGKLARRHLDEFGFTGARALLVLGVKPD